MARGLATTQSSTPDGGAVLGKGARVRGRVHGEGDLHVDGQVEGDVSITGELAIGDGGAITGDVNAETVIIGGALTGDVTAQGAVTIRANAKVVGSMGGAEVSIEEGASFSGRIDAEFDLPAELLARHGAR